MKAIVVYNSKRGSTERYARWIAESLECEAVKLTELGGRSLSDFDCVIFGGWLRGSGIVGYDKFKALDAGLESRTILFAVGISEYTPQNYMQICQINFPETAEGKVDMSGMQLFYCPGAYEPDKVRGLDRLMMGFAKSVLKGGKTAEGAEAADRMVASIENGVDMTDRKYADQVVKAAKKLLIE